MDELVGKTAVITGAASGIGLELAHRLGDAGMRLVLADIEAAPLAEAAAALADRGCELISQLVDVRDLDQVRALEAAAVEAFGKVHVLCNNAGVGAGGAVGDPDDIEIWRWTIDINLWGVIYGCKVFLPAMIEHGEPCHVVNTASMAGLGAAPLMGAYNVSKYGVVALSETLSREMQMAQTAVGVSVLCPAFVRTGIATSGRNMPDAVRSTVGATDKADFGRQSMIEELVASGIGTDVVADAVLDAIRNDNFWILTHDETKPAVVGRADEIVNGINPSLRLGLS